MFYVSKFDDLSAIEVTDTVDNSVEIYDLQTLVDINNSGTAIIGIDSNGIWKDYNIDKALSEFYIGDMISEKRLFGSLFVLHFTDKRFIDAYLKKFYNYALVCMDLMDMDNTIREFPFSCYFDIVRYFNGVVEDNYLRSRFNKKIDKKFFDLSPLDPVCRFDVDFTRFKKQYSHVVGISDNLLYLSLSHVPDGSCYAAFRTESDMLFGNLLFGHTRLDGISRVFKFSESSLNSCSDLECVNSCNNFSDAPYLVLQHFLVESSGELMFLVMSTTGFINPRYEVCEDLLLKVVSFDDLIDLIKAYGVESFGNCAFNGNILTYTGVNGEFSLNFNRYGYNVSTYLCNNSSVVNSLGYVHTICPDNNGLAILPDGVEYISGFCKFSDIYIDNGCCNLYEIIFPSTFKDALDCTGNLSKIFEYLTSGKDFKPIKLTFKGDYISDFFKPFKK